MLDVSSTSKGPAYKALKARSLRSSNFRATNTDDTRIAHVVAAHHV
jgi:hypothetical protein